MGGNLIDAEQRTQCLALARESIRHGLLTGHKMNPPKATDNLLVGMGACFVTLTIHGQLRGCIGTLEPYRSLIDDICGNAYSSAFQDSRFPQVTNEELATLTIGISVLGPLEEIQFTNEDDLIRQIIPYEDGLVLEEEHHRGTFLPIVWDSLPTARVFLTELKRKAGLPSDYWSSSLRCSRYRTIIFKE
ncbi:hypothetical protein A9Q99_04710 [Gammaproteobacteria bacterium 45_16_T64]|nr:hypothetical protein A9Q99_04710 [Gammaproteobacteria bacterium 45_16_T64]